ncbi:MAG: clostripain-related cysteine peptidase [Desulfurococcales archaeon]|nr:clostripain-related cysteine peptidase [Desulfurococcales archaeon]
MRSSAAAALVLALVLTLLLPLAAPLVQGAAQGEAKHHYKWTIMVYMDADNNLEDAGISDFNEMEVAGSTSDVAILVLMDRIPGYDSSNGNWTDARIYLVLHDTDNKTIHSKLLKDLGEVDMGDPSTVLYFVNYTVHNFPADHYMLVFWDHGNGWKRSQGSAPVKGCCWDYSSNYDYITEGELRWLMHKLASMGIHLDIVGFDACLMQMTEVAYDLMGTADIVVASEEYEPWDGWYYSGFLVPLILNPDMTPAELAAKIVESYKYYYTEIEPLDWVTLSAINLTSLSNAISDLDNMAMLLTYDVFFYPENASAVGKARSHAKKFGSGDYIDLYGFAEAINSTPGFPYDPRPAAARLLSDLNASVIANYAGPSEAGAHGISIYFPPDVDWYLEERYWYFYQVALASNTWWGWFLDYYFYTMKPTEHLRVKVVVPAVATPGSNTTVYILTSYGKADIYVDQLQVYLMAPNGFEEPVKAFAVTPGVYAATIHLPASNSSTPYLVRAKADYWFLSASDGAVIYASKELGGIPALSENLTALKAVIEEYGGYIEAIRGDVAVIKTLVGDINVSVNNLHPALESVENGIATLNTSLGALRVDVHSLYPMIETINDGIAIIRTTLGDIQASLSTLKPEIEAIRGDVAIVKTTLGTVNVSLSQLKPVIVSIQGDVAVIKTTLGTLKGTIESIQGDVATVKTSLGTLKASLSESIAALKKSQEEGFKDVKNTVKSSSTSIGNKISKLEANITSLSDKVENISSTLTATEAILIVTLIVAAAAAYGSFRRG